jgi:CrcB protein
MDIGRLVGVALGGAAGSVLRYLVGLGALAVLGDGFAWGTLFVNVVGSFLLGGIVAAALAGSLSQDARVILGTGVMGGFTTYSTFSLETWKYLQDGAYGLAAANVALTVAVCLAGTAAGMAVAKALLAG